MTIQELRDLLAKHPDDLRVMVRGYESGFEDLQVGEIKVISVRLNVHEDSSVYGPHDWASREKGPPLVVPALLLDRAESEYRDDE